MDSEAVLQLPRSRQSLSRWLFQACRVPRGSDFILISFCFRLQVLEYMGGGDLLNLLIERDVFEEDFTRFYVAEVGINFSYHYLCLELRLIAPALPFAFSR